MQGWWADTNGSLNFKGNSYFGGGIGTGQDKIYEDEFGPSRAPGRAGAFFGEPERKATYYSLWTYGSKQFNKRLSVFADLSISLNNIDYDFGAGPDYPRVSPAALQFGQSVALDPGLGRGIYAGFGFDTKPTDNLSTSISYNRSSLRRNDTGLLAYESNYFSWRTTYQFSRFMNFKARTFYDTLSDRISGQYTFAWTPSVGKALYVGYNSSTSFNGRQFGAPHSGLMQLNRTFFVKMSYLFRRKL